MSASVSVSVSTAATAAAPADHHHAIQSEARWRARAEDVMAGRASDLERANAEVCTEGREEITADAAGALLCVP